MCWMGINRLTVLTCPKGYQALPGGFLRTASEFQQSEPKGVPGKAASPLRRPNIMRKRLLNPLIVLKSMGHMLIRYGHSRLDVPIFQRMKVILMLGNFQDKLPLGHAQIADAVKVDGQVGDHVAQKFLFADAVDLPVELDIALQQLVGFAGLIIILLNGDILMQPVDIGACSKRKDISRLLLK